jgi:hypothetical protein
MENLKEKLEDLYSQIYDVCDDEGSDDVLCLLDDICAQEGVEDISERYFADEELTEEEKRRRLLELPPALPLKDRPPLGSDRVLRPRVQRVVATAAIGEVDCEQLGGETISEVLDALGCWHFENAQYAGAVKVTVGQAIKSAEAELWIAAMKTEIESLINDAAALNHRPDPALAEPFAWHATAVNYLNDRLEKLNRERARLLAYSDQLPPAAPAPAH